MASRCSEETAACPGLRERRGGGAIAIGKESGELVNLCMSAADSFCTLSWLYVFFIARLLERCLAKVFSPPSVLLAGP